MRALLVPMLNASRSIRWRLIAAAALTIAVALAVAGMGLQHLFSRHVERRAVAELETDLRQLLAGLSVAADGTLTLTKLPNDQRYAQAFSGAYWQIVSESKVVRRSRSLWDEELSLPVDELPAGDVHTHVIAGPQNQHLLVVERTIAVKRPHGTFEFRLSAALDRSESVAAVGAFGNDLALALTLLGGCLLAAFGIAVGVGLSPLDQLRNALIRLRAGSSVRLEGAFPKEVEPLVDDLNHLLEQRDNSIALARARAADLAHGLKTPIAAISVIAEELGDKGDQEIADELAGYVSGMQGHVECELVRARRAEVQANAVSEPLVSIVDPLVRSMRRLPRGAEIEWLVDVDDGFYVKVDKVGLAEALGNLLDNARKWACSRVQLRAFLDNGSLVVEIVDDGVGVPEADLGNMVARGLRLDERVPGSGFGLPIAVEHVEQIGARMELSKAKGGGLRARIVLPPALFQF